MSLFAPREASAETITDGADFSMDLDPRVKDVCVFIPETRAHEAACDGIDTKAAAASITREEKSPIFGAVGRVNGWTLMLMASRESAQEEVKSFQLERLAASLRGGMARGMELMEPLPPPTLGRVNGVQVVDVSALAHGPRDVDIWMGTSLVVAANAVYMVWASTDAAHGSDASDIMQASLRTLKASPPQKASMPEEEKYARAGDRIAYIMEAVGGVVFLGFLVWLGLRNRRTPLPTTSGAEGTKKWPKRKRNVVSWEKNKDEDG